MSHKPTHIDPNPTGNASEQSEFTPVVFPPLPSRSGQPPIGSHPVRLGSPFPTAILAVGSVGTSLRRDVSVVSRPVASSATGLNQAPFQSTRACSPSRPWQKSPRPMWAIDPVSPVEQVHPKLQNRQGRTSPRLSVVLLEPRNCVPNWGASHG